MTINRNMVAVLASVMLHPNIKTK